MNIKPLLLIPTLLLFIFSCKESAEEKPNVCKSYPVKTHSYANTDSIRIHHMDLDLAVDFTKHVLKGSVTYQLEGSASRLLLDTYELDIKTVKVDNKEVKFEYKYNCFDKEIGKALKIPLEKNSKKVTITYETSPNAQALQWLSAEQTQDKKHPFLYTQGQSIYTRSWIPIQDTPEIRFTYTAKIKTDKGLLALMSAENPKQKNANGTYFFSMKQPIPPYLLALAVGDVEYKAFDGRSGIYAEPSTLKMASEEFSETPKMMKAAEKLYGPYQWGQYDLIVMPPSFPFGGMENPRLTFVTPTVLVGDKSLTSLVAHELAHSWSGNLVTNASWEDFWLNEGLTTYSERRIMEELYGNEYLQLLEYEGKLALDRSVASLTQDKRTQDIRLRLDLTGRHPDEGVTDIPYEKGYFFLKLLEQTYGREKFDAFLTQYYKDFHFKTITTKQFLTYLNENLTHNDPKLQIEKWVYGNTIPENFPKINNEVFKNFPTYDKVTPEITKTWKTQHWIYFINQLKDLDNEKIAQIDAKFKLSESKNAEIFSAWNEVVLPKKYDAVVPYTQQFLLHVGRTKFLEIMYPLLIDNGYGKEARETYTKARPMYHTAARGVIDKIMKK